MAKTWKFVTLIAITACPVQIRGCIRVPVFFYNPQSAGHNISYNCYDCILLCKFQNHVKSHTVTLQKGIETLSCVYSLPHTKVPASVSSQEQAHQQILLSYNFLKSHIEFESNYAYVRLFMTGLVDGWLYVLLWEI